MVPLGVVGDSSVIRQMIDRARMSYSACHYRTAQERD